MRLIDLDAIMAQFPDADFDGDVIENTKAYPHWRIGIVGLINVLKAVPIIEQSEDCISRETAIDQFIHWYSELLLSQKEEVSFEDILKSLPSVLPQHKKGKWIRYDVDIAFHPLHCSICGWSNHHIINKCIEEFQFCPNCGADMRGESK